MWAAEWYISTSISSLFATGNLVDQGESGLRKAEHGYLRSISNTMPQIPQRRQSRPGENELSEKARALIATLHHEVDATFTGLVVVEQSDTAAALAELLTAHFGADAKVHIGTFAETISMRRPGVRSMAELRNQLQTLRDFESGELNLIIATRILAGRINIAACRLVMYLDPPKTLELFAEHRGQEREQTSRVRWRHSSTAWMHLQGRIDGTS